jgi:hypothetical protein
VTDLVIEQLDALGASYEVVDCDPALADTAEFKFARYNLPLDRSDTIFVYASTPFLQNLLTPQYQIELRRRNQIVTDIMMLEMASLAAAGEGFGQADVPQLISQGFLPQGFGARPDAGRVDVSRETWVDSVRGRRGFFVPIPDLPIAQVSQEEAAWYRERAQFFTANIKRTSSALCLTLGWLRLAKRSMGG